MAFNHENTSPQRLLPPSLEDRLLRFLARGLGAMLCLMSVIGWVSLLSWSAADPSPMQATGGVTHNWLGSTGAAVADLLLQTLGIASLFALLAPMMWGIELWLAERLPGARLKLMLFPLAVLLLAGGFSALPVLGSWPLHRGIGGMLGDLNYNLLATALGNVNPARGGAVAGFLLFAVGMAALTHTIGLSWRNLLLLLKAATPLEFPDRRQNPRYVSWWGRWRQRRVQREPEPPTLDPSSNGNERRIWHDPTAVGTAAPPVYPPAGQRPPEPSLASILPLPQPVPQSAHQSAPMPDTPLAPRPMATPSVWPQTPPRQSGIGTQPVLPQMMSVNVPTVPLAATVKPPKPHDFRSPVAIAPTAPVHAAQRIAMSINFASQHSMPFGVSATSGPGGGTYNGTERRARPRDPVFEKSTESGSRSIAARFAPSSGVQAGPARAYTNTVAAQAARKPGLLNNLSFRRNTTAHQRPSLNLLMRPGTAKATPEVAAAHLQTVAGRLEHGLAEFGIAARVIDMRAGPVVTEFVIEPTPGTKLSRIVALADDIARAIGVPAVRILAHGGGYDHGSDDSNLTIGIEVPNVRAEPLLLRDVLDSDTYRTTENTLPLAVGKTTSGAPCLIDLATAPHLLVVGTPHSGKSVGLNAMILSLLFRHAPEDCRLLLIDTSMLDFGAFNAIPHLLTPVISEPARGVAALQWAAAEVSERYKRMAQLGLQDVSIYNNRVRDAKRRGEVLSRTVQTGFDPRSGLPVFEESPLAMELMPAIVVLVDEFADLMLANRHDTELAVQQLAANARNAGIHLVLATERPTPDVVTPALKAALPARMTFKLNSKAESRLVLGETGAEHLLGHGDMLLRIALTGSTRMTELRVHGALVSPEEIESVAASVRAQGAPRYVEGLGEPAAPTGSEAANWVKVG
jgi:DNA segregation ATPase FtsK/SpoIIIE, S-DNA-T family